MYNVMKANEQTRCFVKCFGDDDGPWVLECHFRWGGHNLRIFENVDKPGSPEKLMIAMGKAITSIGAQLATHGTHVIADLEARAAQHGG